MKCMQCRGEMKKAMVAYTVDRQGYHLFIKKIPAYVCSQCGEKYFEEKEVRVIQSMLKVFEKKLKEVTVST